MLKVLATCGNGMGSSMMMELRVKKVFDKQGLVYDIGHCSLGEALSIANSYDVIFCPMSFRHSFTGLNEKVKLIPLANVMSEVEITEKCKEHGIF
jgi:PTS system ascorbate-specific IIB component